MKVIIIGCGRVGSTLATGLDAEGHAVAIIDKRGDAFERWIPEAFSGLRLKGSGFDRELLEQAGIEEADAFLAVTNGDNSNVVSARIASEHYKVPKVIARIYDPRRADIYRRLGIPTVATVTWTVGKIRDLLSYTEYEEEASYGNGEIALIRADLPLHLAGRKVTDLQVPGEISLIEITRKGRAFIPGAGSVLAEGDVLRFIISRDGVGMLDKFLGRG